MSVFYTECVGGPMDGYVWESSQSPRQDEKLTFTRDFDGMEAVYYFQWDYQGRGPRFAYFRSQMPIKSK